MLLSIFAMSMMINGSAAVYTLGVSKNDEFVYQVTTVDEDGLETVFGTGWASYLGEGSVKGVKWKYLITKIDEETTYWKVTMSFWDATVGEFEEFPDSTVYLVTIYKDPASSSGIYYFCPTPVSNYLEAAYGASSSYEVEGNSYTYTNSYYNIDHVLTFDSSSGAMSSMKYVYVGKTIWEIRLSSTIPGYELPILLGITAVSTIGLIYIVMKKKK